MRRKLWITVGILAIVMLVASFYYVRRRYFFPNSDVPVTNQVGWWAYQDNLTVSEFDCEVVESRFGLLRTGEALVRFRIKGEVSSTSEKWNPYIKVVHISERLIPDENSRSADFGITPVVGLEDKAGNSKKTVPFAVKVEYVLHALHWGDNKYMFHCGGIDRELTIPHPK